MFIVSPKSQFVKRKKEKIIKFAEIEKSIDFYEIN